MLSCDVVMSTQKEIESEAEDEERKREKDDREKKMHSKRRERAVKEVMNNKRASQFL